MKVSDIMSEHLICSRPDDTIVNVSQLMAEQDVGAIPICDDQHNLLGIVTDRDLIIRGYAEGKMPDEKVEQCMTEDLITANADMTVKEAGEVMGQNQIRRLPILKGKKIIGIVSLKDLAIEQHSNHIASEALEDISEQDHIH
ncbi:CBS domain-containing protein [Amphibacillus sp. MSJ-3]|uniref:CBS domain-containing protein n=1 Tax=Amphibacillus sp. MSJ-3 TaxID=2841505 RepID=UPI0020A02410|nr:CBS domain-containing protein [Amphibacillus sp. MSJ-3]